MRIKKKFKREFALFIVLLSILIYITIPKFLSVQNIDSESYFPDPNFRTYIEKRIFSFQPTGRFTAREIASISGFKIHGSDGEIKTLDGIEYFSNLIGLHLTEHHQLKRIDLSKNLLLRDVFMENNHALQEIIFPKPNRIRKLLWYNSGLHEIDLPELPYLEEIYLGKNHLFELDVSKCPKLRILQCEENQLRELDLSNNPNIEILILTNNRFETIPDVLHLKYLKALDVSGNPLSKVTPESMQKLANQLGTAKLITTSHWFQAKGMTDNRLVSGFVHDPTPSTSSLIPR